MSPSYTHSMVLSSTVYHDIITPKISQLDKASSTIYNIHRELIRSELISDCIKLDTLMRDDNNIMKEEEDNEHHDKKRKINQPTYRRPTFWFSLHTSPRCRLENVVKAILDDVVAGINSYVYAGAEWWIQVLYEEEENNCHVPWHWDTDCALMTDPTIRKEDRYKFPYIATVTYLDGKGKAPTFILENTCISFDHAGRRNPLCGIQHGLLSYPSLFKHVRFNGAFLHGALSELSRSNLKDECGDSAKTNDSSMRITLLVNVWVDRKPRDITPLDDSLVHVLNGLESDTSMHMSFDKPVLPMSIKVCSEENKVWETSEPFQWDDRDAELCITLPLQSEIVSLIDRGEHTFSLDFAKGNTAYIKETNDS